MGTICPYCNIEVSESSIEAEDGCCPECGSIISVNTIFDPDNAEFDEDGELDIEDEFNAADFGDELDGHGFGGGDFEDDFKDALGDDLNDDEFQDDDFSFDDFNDSKDFEGKDNY